MANSLARKIVKPRVSRPPARRTRKASVSRETVRAFFTAFLPLQPEKFKKFLADDVVWTISGPIELMRYCGQWRGKPAVIEMFEKLIPPIFRTVSFTPAILLVDGDRASALCKLYGTSHRRRAISYHVAVFIRFRDGKIVDYHSLIDSFNAAEQIIGHEIDLSQDIARQDGSVIVLTDKIPV